MKPAADAGPMHLLDHPPEAVPELLARWDAERGQPGYRARQIQEHVYQGRRARPEQMPNLPR